MSWKKNLTIGTLLAGATALGIHMINKAIYLSATLDNLLNHTPETYYEWKFGKIFYTKQGEGKPLLLIHDLNTYSSACEWDEVVEALSKERTVYTLDLLGCGRSEKPNLTYTNFLYVQMITDFIKHIIGDKTDVIATGESSAIALGACQGDDSGIDSIIMVNPADIHIMSQIPTNRSRIITKLIELPLVGTLLYNILTTRNNIDTIFRTKYFYDQSKIKNETIRTYYESAHCGNAASKYLFASLSGNYLTANIPHYLDSLTNSIFIIAGDEQDYLDIAESYKKALPSAEIIQIPETDYLPQLELPAAFVEQVKVYLPSESAED